MFFQSETWCYSYTFSFVVFESKNMFGLFLYADRSSHDIVQDVLC